MAVSRVLISGLALVSLVVPASASAASMGEDPRPGTPGLGDPLYPLAGNGGYNVRHYTLDFSYRADAAKTFEGKARIVAKAEHALSRFNLDFDGHRIRTLTVNGEAADWRREAAELVVTPAESVARGERFTVVVRYDGVGTGPYVGESAWRFGPDGGFTSLAAPVQADTLLPLNNHPSDKATWTFRITAPQGFVAVGNGELTRRREAPNGASTWVFEERERMAAGVIGIGVVEGAYVRGTGPHGLPLRHVLPADKVEQYAPFAAMTGEQIAWLESRLGRYPFSTYGIHVYDGYGAALENQTLAHFDPRLLDNGHIRLMVHELAHQWFGNSVTQETWQDTWLSEGFAFYLEAAWAAEHGGEPLVEQMHQMYDKSNEVRPTEGPPAKPKSLIPGFTIYHGGATVLYALRQQVGDKTFERILRTWLVRYQGRTADSEDFIRHATTVSRDPGLEQFLRPWLYDPEENPPMPGHPDW